jgi:hypothetical protein
MGDRLDGAPLHRKSGIMRRLDSAIPIGHQ